MATNLRPAQRIGVTMRVTHAGSYEETRDALAQDWAEFLAYALPEVMWVPLPNLGRPILDFARRWMLDGFILTGGNDLGEIEVKDQTDFALVEWSQSSDLPVFGVCRGLQVIHHLAGGKLSLCSADQHVAKHHSVTLSGNLDASKRPGKVVEVNSFHRFGVALDGLSSGLVPFATTDDGWVEGLCSVTARIRAVMWHPERERPFREFDRFFIRNTFGLE